MARTAQCGPAKQTSSAEPKGYGWRRVGQWVQELDTHIKVASLSLLLLCRACTSPDRQARMHTVTRAPVQGQVNRV